MCSFDDQAVTVTAWLGSSDTSAIVSRHCTFRFPLYLSLYKILLMEKISIPWKTVKGTSSLLKKIKCFGKTDFYEIT